MPANAEAEHRRLGAMIAGVLRQRYPEVGGDEARSRNREYLIRRMLWMLQAGVYGGLSERAVALADGLEFKVRHHGSPRRSRRGSSPGCRVSPCPRGQCGESAIDFRIPWDTLDACASG